MLQNKQKIALHVVPLIGLTVHSRDDDLESLYKRMK